MVHVREDLTGKRFGRWIVICQVEDYITPKGKHHARWLCECGCEKHTRKEISQPDLKKMNTSNSCGCILQESYAKFHDDRINNINYNSEGYQMKIIEYINTNNILVEFLDDYHAVVKATYSNFYNGKIKNPYVPNVCGVGRRGNKYQTYINGKQTKEYVAWHTMIDRCYGEKGKKARPTYKNVTCCDEWLLFENFYEWLHSQDNFDKWINGNRYALDKDILVKRNKIYSPETCCLVPDYINTLFIRKESCRGSLPIGVRLKESMYHATCHNPIDNKQQHIGIFRNKDDAFLAYKRYKESLIQQIAKEELGKGNITEECYNAMMNYKVEITD